MLIASNCLANELKIIVPNSPGGLLDISARKIQIENRNIVIEYRPGAKGKIAIEHVKNSKESMVLLVTSNIIAENEISNLIPIARLSRSYNAVIVSDKWDGKFNAYGSVGVGSYQHKMLEHMFRVMKINAIHVPYKGSGDIVRGLLSNEISVANITMRKDLLTNSKIKIYAVTADKGEFGYPSLRERGIPISFYNWLGVLSNTENEKDTFKYINDSFFDEFQKKAFLNSEQFSIFLRKTNEQGINTETIQRR